MAKKTYPHGEECRYQAGRIHPLVAELPHYHLVEKDPAKHLAWRLDIIQRASQDKHMQGELRKAFAADPLFFVNCVLWILEPREGEFGFDEEETDAKFIPFNTWCNQDPVIASIAKYWGKRHMIGDKSRAQGASWIMCALIVWGFLFKPGTNYGVGSKDEESADDPSDPGSLGWKIDFLIEQLPPWLKPTGYHGPKESWRYRSASKSTWENRDARTFIKCYSATKGIGRGGRATVFFLDESAFFPKGDREAFANLVRVTNCVVAISTPHGMDNAHYDYVHKPGPWLKVILDWKDNPRQAQGLYTAKNGKLQFIDKCFDWQRHFPDGYDYKLDGRTRSPWYDEQCEIHGNDMLFIAQELDREYSGSQGRPFQKTALERMQKFCMKPLHVGELEYDYVYPADIDAFKWHEGEAYKFDLWVPLDSRGFPPAGKYFFGIDLCRGVGGELSSNSCISMFNELREQVGELADNTIDPIEFAHLAVALAYWFGHGQPTTRINWEIEGPGVEFGQEIEKRLAYPNLRPRPVGDEDRRMMRKPSGLYGYSNKNRDKAIRSIKAGIVNQSVTIRSEALLEECGQYVIGDDGKPMHPGSKTARDGSAKGISHGDRVIAASMAILAMDELLQEPRRRKKRADLEIPSTISRDSIAGRMRLRAESERQRKANFCRW